MDKNVKLAKKIIFEAFEINDVNKNFSFKDTEKWDSLGHMKLIGIIEKKIKRKLLSKEILKANNFKNIVKILKKN